MIPSSSRPFRFLKTALIVVLFLQSGWLRAQNDWSLPFSGRVQEYDDKKGKEVSLDAAIVTLFQGSSQISQVTTSSNGKFNFKIAGNGDYTMTVTKPGYITKRFSIVTTNVPDDRSQAGFGGFDITVVIFKMYPGLDYSILNKPLAKINYVSAKDVEDFDYDKNYTALMLNELEKLKELEKQIRERERKYNEAVAAGDKAFQAQKYSEAKPFYETAKNIKPDEPYPPAQIAECDKRLGAANAQAQQDKEYNDAMNAGNTSLSASKYDDAIASFEKALGIKANDPTATARLAEAKNKKQAAADSAKKDADYAAAMQRATTAFAAAKYEDAKKEYQAALGLKAGDAPATKGIADCDAKIKELANAAAAQAKYDDAMKRANADFAAAKYADAKKEYQEALAVKANDGPATKGVADCDAKLGAEAKYADAMKRGADLFSTAKYEDAKSAYQEALALKAGDAPATKGIADCDAKIKENMNAAALQAKYDDAMKRAGADFAAAKYDVAKKEYQEALAVKTGDAAATKGVSDCDAQLAIKKKYDDAMKAGATAMTAKKYQDAVNAFNDALAAIPGDATATAKRDEAQNLLNGAMAQNKADADYAAAMAQAKNDFAATKYADAKVSYEKALSIKAGDAGATKGIADCDAKIAAQAKYDEAMKRGDAAFGGSDWDGAIAAYNDALSAIPKDADATKKLADATAKKNASLSAAQKQKQYDDAMAAAKAAFDKQDYVTAKASFQKALAVKAGDADATKGVSDCDAQLAIKKKYDDAMKAGATAMTAKKYQDAVNAFSDALAAVPGDATATTKRDEAQKLLAGAVAQGKADADYAAAMAQAKEDFTAAKYASAKTFYTTALGIKNGDAAATKGIADCDAKIAAQAKYDEAMKRGDGAAGSSDWDGAIAAYNDALSAIPKDAAATQKLADVTAKKNASLSAAQKQKQYDDAMAAAKAAFDKQDYLIAKASFQKALAVRAGDADATKGVSDCDALLATKKKYDDAMKAGATAMTAKKYQDAVNAFNDALAAVPGDVTATGKRDEAQKLLDGAVAQGKVEADYNAAMKKALDLFNLAKYDDAKASYQAALNIKAGDGPAQAGINKCDMKLKELADKSALKAKYDDAMKRGNDAMTASTWDDAISAFNEALVAVPKDPEATKRLAEANKQKMASLSAAQKKEAYDKAMAAAKAAFDEGKYPEAKKSYQDALGAKPSDDMATKGVADCDAKIKADADRLANQRKFDAAMNKGNTAMADKKYQGAIDAYSEALNIFPDDANAHDKLDAAKAALAASVGAAQIEQRYNDAMTRATALFTGKKYEEAKSAYQEALGVKPGDAKANDGIANCDKAIAQRLIDDQYTAAITEADRLFEGKDYNGAKGKYQEALSVKANEPYPKGRITECEKQISMMTVDGQYAAAIADADRLFNDNKLQEARTSYVTASGLKPTETYPKERVGEIDRRLKKMAADDAKYKALIDEADKRYAAQDFKGAKEKYQAAVPLKPVEAYPKLQIVKCDQALNPKTTTDPVTTTTTDPYAGMKDKLASKYPQGVTEEMGSEPNCQVTYRILVKGNVGWVYSKKVYSWGGVFYFKDGVQITENAFNAETAH